MRLRLKINWLPTKIAENNQYSTVGFHLIKASFWKTRVAVPKTTMTPRLSQWVVSMVRARKRSHKICATTAAMATPVATYKSKERKAKKNKIKGNKSKSNFLMVRQIC